MYIKTKAIVFSSVKFKDADLIVKCYTKAKGIVSFMVKGVLKSKKGKLRPAMFQTLNLLDIEFQYKDKGRLEYFKEVKVYQHLNGIQNDIYKSSLVMFLSEILKSVIYEEEQNDKLFDFIEYAILYLDNANHFANFHLSFLVNLSSYLGFFPHTPEQSSDQYFNLSEGYFESAESKYSLSKKHSSLFLQFVNHALEKSEEIKLNKKDRQDLLHLLLVYYQLHIENFQNPKSLKIIESIFN